jgi:hypothetical protein
MSTQEAAIGVFLLRWTSILTKHVTDCVFPTGGSKDSPNRYACCYLFIGADEVGAARQVLPTSIIEMLDGALPTLPQS